jgi:hypothetical protein
LDWVILRPSVVVGRAAYGGSALLRGLAALPVLPKIAGMGRLQIVQLDDLVDTVVFLLRNGAPSRRVVEVVGPERLTFDQVLVTYRRWLGGNEAGEVPIPRWLSDLCCKVGDLAGALGWRSPMRTTAHLEMGRGSIGDPASWTHLTGIRPRALRASLAAEPASVQERRFARLYFFKPLTLAVLSVFWIVTGLIALGPGWEEGLRLVQQAGFAAGAAWPIAAAGAIADILIGIGIAIRRSSRTALYAAIALSVIYAALATVLLPGLWRDPLGPLLKIAPLLVLSLVAVATLDDR